VCSADTRDLRRDDALSDAWSDDVDVGDAIGDIVEDIFDEKYLCCFIVANLACTLRFTHERMSQGALLLM
jgi:hypothetical protein